MNIEELSEDNIEFKHIFKIYALYNKLSEHISDSLYPGISKDLRPNIVMTVNSIYDRYCDQYFVEFKSYNGLIDFMTAEQILADLMFPSNFYIFY